MDSRAATHWPARWTTAPVAIAGSIDDHCRYLTALRAAPGQASSDPVWVVMLAGIAEYEHPVSVVARQ